MSQGHHHESLTEAPPELASERSTGLVFAAVAAIAAVLLRHHLAFAGTAAAIAAAFAAVAMLWPSALAPLNRAWFRLALVLNRFVSPVVMFVIYAVVIVPAGLVMQRLRDPLQRARGSGRASYWIERTAPQTDMRDQF